MKTTEIFVEQVLIGFILLGIIIALAFPCHLASFPGFESILALQSECAPVKGAAANVSTPTAIGLGALLTGLAYFLGLIYDRIADTLCAAWEQHNRLQVALKDVERGSKEELPKTGDPFPEDKIRYVVQGNTSRVEWADYLRSRIRLTRALATLMPALGVAVAVIASAPDNASKSAIALLAIYLAVLIATMTGQDKLAAAGLYPPKTRESDWEKLQEYWRQHRSRNKQKGNYKGVALSRRTVFHEPTLRGLAAVMLLTWWGGATGLLTQWTSIAIALGTGGLTMLIGYVWWRIDRTFFYYLKSAYEMEKELDAERIAWEAALSSKREESSATA